MSVSQSSRLVQSAAPDSCSKYYHKKCTEFKSLTGRHWKPSTWKCKKCSYIDTATPSTDVIEIDTNDNPEHISEPPNGLRPKLPNLTGKQRKSNVTLKLSSINPNLSV